MLSDIVADHGRLVRLRYCSHPDYAVREEGLPYLLDIAEAMALIRSARVTMQPGA